jgi:hypothetical protein
VTLTDDQARNIQGIGIAGFRKDRQLLIFARIRDPKKALGLLRELAHRTANAWEVKRFNEVYSEIRARGCEDEEAAQATWVATLLSASGRVDLAELPACEAAKGLEGSCTKSQAQLRSGARRQL